MTSGIDPQALASHVLVALAHARGRVITLDDLSESLDVRRGDLRHAISRLHQEGYVDAMKLRLTLPGLALAAALDGCKLPPLRTTLPVRIAAA